MMDISMSALVIIDAQNAIFSLKQPIYGEEMLKEKLALLTDWASHNHVKIICTQHNNNSFLKKGTPGWEVIELLRIPAGSIMIEKNKPSIFEKTELHTLLQAAGIKTLMLAGLISNGCVKDSCIDALRLNYEVVLISDAHSTFYKNAGNIIKETNQYLQSIGVRLTAVDNLLSIRPLT